MQNTSLKIAILEPLALQEGTLRKIAAPLTDAGHELVIYPEEPKDTVELKERTKDIDVAIIANMPFPAEVIDAAKNLKMISVAFTGVDHVAMNACREKSILVSNAAGYSTPAVAELAFGLMIDLYRTITPLNTVVRKGGTKDSTTQRELRGKTLGVVGTGAIGSRVAEIGLAFGCHVIAHNRSKHTELTEKGVTYKTLDEVMSEADIVSIHLPLLETTRHIIDKEKLALMKPNAILINTARGPVVDSEALAKALNDGKIAGAGIDVFDTEPPIDTNDPLLSAKNTILTPHIAFATEEAMHRRAEITIQNITAWQDDAPQNVIK